MPRLRERVAEHAAVGVVGLPLTGEGEEGESAAAARQLAEDWPAAAACRSRSGTSG